MRQICQARQGRNVADLIDVQIQLRQIRQADKGEMSLI